MIWLDNARIVAILAVVLLHVAASVVLEATIGSGSWWAGNLYDAFVRWCVPVFVMISGALLLSPDKQEDLSAFYRKRVSRVLIPILFWSVFFLLWGVLKGAHLTTNYVSTRLLSGQPHYHMWFLYMIITLYLFTPFFRKVVATSSRRELTLLVLMTLALAALHDLHSKVTAGSPRLFVFWFLSYVPYFFLGHLIRTAHWQPDKPLLLGVLGASGLLTAGGLYYLATLTDLKTGLYFYNYLSITVIPMSVSVMYLLKTWTAPIISQAVTQRTANLTLGVYLIHPVFLEIITYAGFRPSAFYPILSIPLLAALVFLLSLCAAWVMSKLPYLQRVI